MSTLFIDRKGVDIDAEADTIVVRADGERRGTIPLRPLERVVVKGTARLTTRLIARLMEQGIALTVLAGRAHQPAASFAAPGYGDTQLRLAQYALALDEPARARLSIGLIAAKLRSQHKVLDELSGSRKPKAVANALRGLGSAIDGLAAQPGPGRGSLRGIEGAAAAAYFSGLAALFPPSLDFTGRNRRPPRDPVNACLSLGYTLLHNDAVRAAAVAGLDPVIGVYHDIKAGRESLACDLAEPFRPLVDRFVHELFRSQALRQESFTVTGAGCRVNKTARQAFFRAYEAAAPVHRRLLGRVCRQFVAELRQQAPQAGQLALAAPPRSHRKETSDEERDMDYRV